MPKLHVVPWIESEEGWGQKSEGYKVFNDLDMAIEVTKRDSSKGASTSGCYYLGPERPLAIYTIELPEEEFQKCKDKKFLKTIQSYKLCHTTTNLT